jgi:hypothetical protein
MFRGLINDAKSAAGSLIAKYLARASVAVPFIVAVGFATAAITLTLVDRFGGIVASWIVAGGFTLIGLVATLVITVKEQEEEVAEKQAEKVDTADVATDAAAQAAAQMPLALLGAVLSSPMGPSTVVGGAKMAARNIPLIVLMALIALLFWPSKSSADETESAESEDEHAGKPNGHDAPRKPNGYHHEAAA